MEELTDRIRSELAADELPDADAGDLLRACAVLVLAKGPLVTAEDMHNAWAAWAAIREPGHDALVPYADLPDDAAQPGRPYLDAIRRVVDSSISGSFAQILLPYGIPVEDKDRSANAPSKTSHRASPVAGGSPNRSSAFSACSQRYSSRNSQTCFHRIFASGCRERWPARSTIVIG